MEMALSFMSSYFISLFRLQKKLMEIHFFNRIKLILVIATPKLYLKFKAIKLLCVLISQHTKRLAHCVYEF